MGDNDRNFPADDFADPLQVVECLHDAVQQLLFLFQEQAERIDAGLPGGGTDMRSQFLEGTADLRAFVPVACQVFLVPDTDGLCPGGKFQQSGIGLFCQVAGIEQFGLVRLQTVAFCCSPRKRKTVNASKAISTR